MNSINYKKHLGLGFLFFFTILLITYVFDVIEIDYESSWSSIRRNWFTWYPILLIVTAIYIAFFRKCQSSLPAKVGCILYTPFLVSGLINMLTYISTGKFVAILSSSPYKCICFGFYVLGIILLTWGSRLWLPAKIAFTSCIALNITFDILFFTSYKYSDSFFSVWEIISWASFAFVIVAFILTIIWMCQKPKPDELFESSDTYQPKLNEI